MTATPVLVSVTADGWIKHWHLNTGRCFHSVKVDYEDPTSQLYTVEYNKEGSLFAAAGNDKYVHIYDENTK